MVQPLRGDGFGAYPIFFRFSHLAVGRCDAVVLAAFVFELVAVVGDVGSEEGSSNLRAETKKTTLMVYTRATYRRSQVSSSATPTGRLPLVYSLQYPPTSNIRARLHDLNARYTVKNDALRCR